MIYYADTEAADLRREFERQVMDWRGVTSRRMLGCPAYLVDGKLFAFLVTGGIVITQVRKRDREELNKTHTTGPFRAGEREIDRWLQVQVDSLERIERVMLMVKKSYDTVRNY